MLSGVEGAVARRIAADEDREYILQVSPQDNLPKLMRTQLIVLMFRVQGLGAADKLSFIGNFKSTCTELHYMGVMGAER